MGFFDGIGRLLQGKPVFQDTGAQPDRPTGEDTRPLKTPVDDRGYKIIPELRVEHCRTSFNGNATQVTAWVTN